MDMKNTLQIPILTEIESPSSIGGPATIGETLKAEVGHALSLLSVDEETLEQCLTAAQVLFQIVHTRYANSPIKTDSISFELGVSGTGKVGFLGIGLDIQAAAKLQITLKLT